MFIYIILSLLQGFLEWWPVSSSSVLIIISKYCGVSLEESFYLALTLHFPSGLAALFLFRNKFYSFAREILCFNISTYTRNYFISLTVSIPIGLTLYFIFINLTRVYGLIALSIIFIGLVTTSILLFIKPISGLREDILLLDWIITGLLQGLSILPGFSRSGLTIGYLCIRGYKPSKAVEASILLAAPVLLLAGLYNLLKLNIDSTILITVSIIVFSTTVLSGRLITYLSRKLRVYVFTILFAVLVFINIVLELIT